MTRAKVRKCPTLPLLSRFFSSEDLRLRPAWIPSIWVRRIAEKQERSWWHAVCEIPFRRKRCNIKRRESQ